VSEPVVVFVLNDLEKRLFRFRRVFFRFGMMVVFVMIVIVLFVRM
jgi:hypothetical protein